MAGGLSSQDEHIVDVCLLNPGGAWTIPLALEPTTELHAPPAPTTLDVGVTGNGVLYIVIRSTPFGVLAMSLETVLLSSVMLFLLRLCHKPSFGLGVVEDDRLKLFKASKSKSRLLQQAFSPGAGAIREEGFLMGQAMPLLEAEGSLGPLVMKDSISGAGLLAIGFLRLFGCCANPRACALVPFSFKLIPTTFEELDASVDIPVIFKW